MMRLIAKPKPANFAPFYRSFWRACPRICCSSIWVWPSDSPRSLFRCCEACRTIEIRMRRCISPRNSRRGLVCEHMFESTIIVSVPSTHRQPDVPHPTLRQHHVRLGNGADRSQASHATGQCAAHDCMDHAGFGQLC